MTGLAELQSGQVAFISGLLGGFALSAATQLLRIGFERRLVRIVFVTLLMTTLLFLVSLYIDVRLTIETAGVESIGTDAASQLDHLRVLGTTSASAGFLLMLLSIGLLGGLVPAGVGVWIGGCAIAALSVIAYVWFRIADLVALL